MYLNGEDGQRRYTPFNREIPHFVILIAGAVILEANSSALEGCERANAMRHCLYVFLGLNEQYSIGNEQSGKQSKDKLLGIFPRKQIDL